jgi:hypothetical protein
MFVFLYLSAPNIIANVRHASLYDYAVSAMRNKLKLSSVRGDSGSKKCKQSCWRLWWRLAEYAFGGNLESGVRRSVCVGCVWQESGFSRREDVFIFSLL